MNSQQDYSIIRNLETKNKNRKCVETENFFLSNSANKKCEFCKTYTLDTKNKNGLVRKEEEEEEKELECQKSSPRKINRSAKDETFLDSKLTENQDKKTSSSLTWSIFNHLSQSFILSPLFSNRSTTTSTTTTSGSGSRNSQKENQKSEETDVSSKNSKSSQVKKNTKDSSSNFSLLHKDNTLNSTSTLLNKEKFMMGKIMKKPSKPMDHGDVEVEEKEEEEDEDKENKQKLNMKIKTKEINNLEKEEEDVVQEDKENKVQNNSVTHSPIPPKCPVDTLEYPKIPISILSSNLKVKSDLKPDQTLAFPSSLNSNSSSYLNDSYDSLTTMTNSKYTYKPSKEMYTGGIKEAITMEDNIIPIMNSIDIPKRKFSNSENEILDLASGRSNTSHGKNSMNILSYSISTKKDQDYLPKHVSKAISAIKTIEVEDLSSSSAPRNIIRKSMPKSPLPSTKYDPLSTSLLAIQYEHPFSSSIYSEMDDVDEASDNSDDDEDDLSSTSVPSTLSSSSHLSHSMTKVIINDEDYDIFNYCMNEANDYYYHNNNNITTTTTTTPKNIYVSAKDEPSSSPISYHHNVLQYV